MDTHQQDSDLIPPLKYTQLYNYVKLGVLEWGSTPRTEDEDDEDEDDEEPHPLAHPALRVGGNGMGNLLEFASARL